MTLSQNAKSCICSLCFHQGHCINSPCNVMIALKIALVLKNETKNFANELGDPKYCSLNNVSGDLRIKLQNTNWD